jgi:2'-5' RNA ligase
MVATVNEKNNFTDNKNERYFYVVLTEDLNVGHQSKHTPQHITLVPPFNADRKIVINITKEVANKFDLFDVKLGKNEFFGSKKDIPVILIKQNNELNRLHINLIKILKEKNIDINKMYQGHFINNTFTPHVTIKKFHPRLAQTKPIKVDHLAVIHKNKNIKTVIAKFMLGEK